MKNQWYGDNRDLVKWGVIAELVRRYDADRILQVLYYRPNDWKAIEVDGQSVAVADAVIKHFRSLKNIVGLNLQARIDLVELPFVDRTEYMGHILDALKVNHSRSCIILLDPDTGLESRTPGPEHVLESELAAIWGKIMTGDVLVFYQHQTNKSGAPWLEHKRSQFERAIGLPANSAKIAQAPSIARDVVFFFCQKCQ